MPKQETLLEALKLTTAALDHTLRFSRIHGFQYRHFVALLSRNRTLIKKEETPCG